MASFTVLTGVTDPAAKTVSNNDVGTIQAGGTLSDGTDITWNGGSAGSTVVINNSGTITATTRGIDTAAAFATGNFTLNNNSGALLTASNDAFRINLNAANGAIYNGIVTVNNAGTIRSTSNGQALDFAAVTSASANIVINNTGTIHAQGDDAIRPGAGHITITNSGLIDSTTSANRAINLNTTNLSNVVSFNLTNNAGGTIQSQGDAVRITATTLTATATGTFVIDNAGTIQSTGVGANNGQAIDFNDLLSTNGHVTVTNEATGVIKAADADAIRPGTNATINNYGQIVSLNGTPTSTGNDGIDFQNNTGGVVNNYAGGTIDGARHGITGNNPITVYNEGTIIGRVGSGINMDTAGNTVTTVTNLGTIIGTSVEGVQSGDAIDVDGQVLINNYGLIQAVGIRSDGTSEGVTVGGGTINNYAGGTITSSQNAIDVDDGTGLNAFSATTIYNEGLIEGDSGVAIAIAGTFADTVTNKGIIIGSISMDGGNDALDIYTGSSISGLSDGGAGIDTVTLLGGGSGTLSAVANFEDLDVAGGNWTIVDDDSFAGGTTVEVGASLTLGNGGTTGTVGGDVVDDGVVTFDHSGTFTFDGAISGGGSVRQAGSGTTVLTGNNSYSGGTEIVSGTLDVAAADAVGTGAITFDVGTETLRIEQAALTGGDFANTIVGFVAGDVIDLAGIGLAASATLGPNNVLTILGGSSGPITLHLDPAHDYTGDVFRLADDGAGGTNVTVELDQAPVFTSSASFSVAENHTDVGTVAAVDPENDGFVFALAGGADQAFFTIDAHSGALAFINSPDFEPREDANHDGVYDIVVSAQDVFGATSTQTISINVTDLAEPGQTFNGGNGNDTFLGTTGNDVMSGGNGNDLLNGGDGNDTISGGNGIDVLIGGRGNDILDGGNDNDMLSGGLGDDTLSGGNGDDVLDGGAGNNILDGGNGNDILKAGNGNNTLTGGNGDDALISGNGNDVLNGGNGNDILTGGAGNDIMTGGNGNDTFVFAASFGNDTVTDFKSGDHIEFDGGVFANFGAVQAAAHQVGADTVITLDASNTITLQNVTLSSLHANDFLFA